MRTERAGGLVMGVLAVLVAARSLVTRLFDPDVWWMLAHGREMMATHRLLSTDIFSHTMLGTPMVNFEWLAEIIFFLLWRAAGPAGLIAFKAAAGVAVGLLLVALARRHGARGPWLALLGWVGFWALRPRLNERAELFTLLALPLALWMVDLARRKAVLRGPVLALVVAGVVVVANAHGGWIFVPALLALRALGAVWAREDGDQVRFLALAAGLTALAGLVNPYGIHVLGVQLTHVIRLTGGLSNRDLIEEWKPTTVGDAPSFWALYLMAIIALLLGLRRRERWAFAWAPAVLVFALWGAQSYRNAALFVFPAVPFLAGAAATPVFQSDRWRRAGWIVLGLLVALQLPGLAKPWPAPAVQERLFPIRACAFVRENNIDGKMFNTLNHGGYIEWALGPERKTFIDGRYFLFPLVQETMKAAMSGEFSRFLDERGVDYAIVDPEAGERYGPNGAGLPSAFPGKDWALVFWDDAAFVLVRRRPRFEALIASHEYRALTPDDPARMDGLSEDGRRLARAELARHEKETGFSVIALALATRVEAQR